MKNGNKIICFMFGFFAVIGAIFFSFGIFLMMNQSISMEDRIYTTAIIERIDSYTNSDGDTSHDVFISYEVDGEEYIKEINSYSTGYYKGKEIEVYYDRNNPDKVRTNNFEFVFLIFSIIGLIFIIIGLCGIIKKVKDKKNAEILKRTGKLIEATYVSTLVNYNYEINGRNPYNIICEWFDSSTNKVYNFKSENIWFNPERYIKNNNIVKFKVYVNPNNYAKYLVDISDIENNVVDLT